MPVLDILLLPASFKSPASSRVLSALLPFHQKRQGVPPQRRNHVQQSLECWCWEVKTGVHARGCQFVTCWKLPASTRLAGPWKCCRPNVAATPLAVWLEYCLWSSDWLALLGDWQPVTCYDGCRGVDKFCPPSIECWLIENLYCSSLLRMVNKSVYAMSFIVSVVLGEWVGSTVLLLVFEAQGKCKTFMFVRLLLILNWLLFLFFSPQKRYRADDEINNRKVQGNCIKNLMYLYIYIY